MGIISNIKALSGLGIFCDVWSENCTVVPIVESRSKSYLSPREEASAACESRPKVVKSSKHVLGLRGGKGMKETGVVPK